jgi:hypothetical protein
VQFLFNTSNFDVTSFSFDWRTSNTSSRWMGWQYTLNGSSWLDGGSFSSAAAIRGTTATRSTSAAWRARTTTRTLGPPSIDVLADGFTQTTSPNQTFGPNAGYRAANVDDRAYATTGTWRFDSVTLNGTYNEVAFTPQNLTWNSDRVHGTRTARTSRAERVKRRSPFAQAGGKGDNVTFNNRLRIAS